MSSWVRPFLLATVLAGCSSEPAPPLNPQEPFEAGNHSLDRGDYAGAIESYSSALALDPSMAQAYNNRGLARAASGDLEGAVRDYDTCIALPNPFAEAFYNRGVARVRLKSLKEAILDFTEAIRLNRSYARAFAGRGLALVQAGDPKGGAADLRKALEVAPSDWPERKAVQAELEKLDQAPPGK
jgi:tetratricopeptide (TPR) repeat protein